MKFEIAGRPEFWFNLTDEQLYVLQTLSSVHYDGVCKQAAKLGGFIYGWTNARAFTKDANLKASWRELDTCCKILEGIGPPLNADEEDVARDLAQKFHAALSHANRICPAWKDEFEA